MSLRLGFQQVAARVKRLPALPRAVHALQAALQHDEVRLDRIVGIVATDQALTLAALRLANSSFYGVSGRVSTLGDAVQILGLHTLSAAVMTAAVMGSFETGSCPGFDFDACWRHAMASALCAQRLAVARGIDADAAYTAGLLHDVGRLALATHFPEQFSATIGFGTANGQPPVDAERAVLGIEHAEVGGLIAQHWRLPAAVVDAIRLHHELPASGGSGLLDALHLSDAITHALDLSNEPDEHVPPVSIGAWERVGLAAAELQPLFAHIEQRLGRAHDGEAARAV